MSSFKNLILLTLTAGLLNVSSAVKVETRTLDQQYAAALAEGGVVTLWHGGDEITQQNSLKTAFEARFPGMTLNLTVDLSKYHDGNIDLQLAAKNVFVDSVMLQTLHDYPRWKSQGALMNYKPAGFDQIYPKFKDADGFYNGVSIIAWSNIWNVNFTTNPPKEFTDFLKPEFKNKIAITYPNDDDAVLYQFQLVIQKYGWAWFDAFLLQNPRWCRGTATAPTLVNTSNGTYIATFGSSIGPNPFGALNLGFPTQANFVSWPQTGAILKKAPHPEGAKLLHSWVVSPERQNGRWSVRSDATKPANYPSIMQMPGTDPTGFIAWMQDRAAVERMRFLIESKIGSAQGLSPLIDGL